MHHAQSIGSFFAKAFSRKKLNYRVAVSVLLRLVLDYVDLKDYLELALGIEYQCNSLSRQLAWLCPSATGLVTIEHAMTKIPKPHLLLLALLYRKTLSYSSRYDHGVKRMLDHARHATHDTFGGYDSDYESEPWISSSDDEPLISSSSDDDDEA